MSQGQGAILNEGEEFLELMRREERAVPELMEYVQTVGAMLMLNHPLVQRIMFDPDRAAVQNRLLKHKQQLVAEALEHCNFHKYVFLHERPYRAHALTVIRVTFPHVEHHKLIESVWTDSDNVWQSQRDWIALFKKLPNPEKLMDDEERVALAALRGKFWVYRGLRNPRFNKLGISWTTDRAKAEWFARRYRMPDITNPVIVHGFVDRSDVIAYLLGRNESEIVILPSKVKRRRFEFISEKPDVDRAV